MLRQESQCFSPVAAGISGFLLSFNRGVRPRLVFRHGTPLSSQVVKGCQVSCLVEVGNLGFF